MKTREELDVARELSRRLSQRLDEEIRKDFPHVRVKEIGDAPIYSWDIDEGVNITLSKTETKEPMIRTMREDPIGRSRQDKEYDWEDYCGSFPISYDEIHLRVMVDVAKNFVRYNRETRERLKANAEAMEKDLGKLVIPRGVKALRDPKTGLYTFEMNFFYVNLRPDAVKQAVAHAEAIRAGLDRASK